MSRFQEADDDYGFNPWNGWYASAMSSKRTNALLRAFLQHLDAMPRKRIALEMFYDPKTGDACTVGEFARMRGMTEDELTAYQNRSAEQRLTLGAEEDGGVTGPTVEAGRKMGLPLTIAWTLGAHNDDLVTHLVEVPGPVDEYVHLKSPSGNVVHLRKPAWQLGEDPQRLMIRVPYTPEERWVAVRHRVVAMIEESERNMKRREAIRTAQHTMNEQKAS